MTTAMLANLPASLAAGYTPFLDPLPIDAAWYLLILPLVAAIAVVYKAIKLDDLSLLPRQAANLTFQIVAFMVLAGAALWLLTDVW